MCLGVPGKIVQVYEASGLRMGKVDFDGVAREVCLTCLPDSQIGEYVIVHVGFAISRVSESDALESIALLKELAALQD